LAIIAIFGGSFCGAEIVAEKSAKILGYDLIDNELLEQAAKRFRIPEEKLKKSIVGQTGLFDRFKRVREKNVAALKIVLSEMMAYDNKVIYNFPAHLIPGYIPNALKVCIIANHEYRIKKAMEKGSASEKEAEKIIHENDQTNLQWTSFLLNKEPYDESLYDIVIPMHSTSINQAVDIISKHAESEQVKSTDRSALIAEDFKLAAVVNLALVENGHDVDVFSENGHVILTINKEVVRMKQYEDELKKIAGKVEGVKSVKTKIGPDFKPSSVNPWANIEIPPKILLVDDEKEFVHTLSERLQTRNIASSVVYDGEQALDFVNKDEPDVMVLDLMMPGIDGIEVLRQIKRDHPRVEVIILTGHGSDKEEKAAGELGAFAYLQKPVNIDVLARVMNEAYQKISRSGKQNT